MLRTYQEKEPIDRKVRTQRKTDKLTKAGFELFEHLRQLRLTIAREEAMPPYIIFSDKTLIDMCVKTPSNRDEMMNVNGVGVNKFEVPEEEKYEPLKVDPAIEQAQKAKLVELRKSRDNELVAKALAELKNAATSEQNVLYPMKKALSLRATGGEVADALREVWGSYQPLK